MSDISDKILDLAPFADLGTEPPKHASGNGTDIVRLTRDGEEVELVFLGNGKIRERSESQERLHASFRALLASSRFGNLAKWAESQRTLLKTRVANESIEILGERSTDKVRGGISCFDDSLTEWAAERRTSVTVLDGPAGIGKTSFIRRIAAQRAESFISIQKPLLLHVESRGRVLQNITDLMAFSLQTLRLNVTYDQLPTLLRSGLVTLAIDGFDELADPNGYELAWAQVNDLIVSARGSGSLILAGRDTFLGHDRMRKALPAIDTALDSLNTFTLQPLSPDVAKQWLGTKGWKDQHLSAEATKPLFEEGSYALRAFFLAELARENVPERIVDGEIQNLLSFLIDSMIEREATKFGRDVEVTTTTEERRQFIVRLMEEVARDIAENQTSTIASDTLVWLAETVSEEVAPKEVVNILKNRSEFIGFLKDDERRGYKSFIHEKVYDFFLSKISFDAVTNREGPKFIRRNIFGRDFLETFAEYVRTKDAAAMEAFYDGANAILETLGYHDRGRGNVGALVLAACSVNPLDREISLHDLSVDEAYLTETVGKISLRGVSINQLDARSTDMRLISFGAGCNVTSILGNEATIPCTPFPRPNRVEINGETLFDPEKIIDWFQRQYYLKYSGSAKNIADALNEFPPFALLARLVRYKPFWLKDGDERSARRILDDPHWDLLRNLLLNHDLIVAREDVPSSGRPSTFYHLRDKNALADLENPPEKVRPFILDLLRESIPLALN